MAKLDEFKAVIVLIAAALLISALSVIYFQPKYQRSRDFLNESADIVYKYFISGADLGRAKELLAPKIQEGEEIRTGDRDDVMRLVSRLTYDEWIDLCGAIPGEPGEELLKAVNNYNGGGEND